MDAIPFSKYHGLGNDFVIVDAAAPGLGERPDWGALAVVWCERRRGIGGDGLLVLCPPTVAGADIRMQVFNADGTEAEMCGNGVRCVAKLALGRRGGDALSVQTGARTLGVRVRRDGGEIGAVTVDMGPPRLRPEEIPVRCGGERVVDAAWGALGGADLTARLTRAGVTARVTCVSMGNPHAVMMSGGLDEAAVGVLGPLVERHAAFPRGVNVQFMRVLSRAGAEVRTWERGAGVTQACGTGACAALVAGVLCGVLGREAAIRLPGGELGVRWDEASDHVFMTGPAEHVFDGEAQVSAKGRSSPTPPTPPPPPSGRGSQEGSSPSRTSR